ncbi:hypothetical protein NGA_0645000, partial [Nannochloropsis gaditana CCMP526]|uniref:uncharacterized protein n=1 Tax=Nannochloropsis gaditana (strain CCMP526) TaxID=1093141 RepID=UPI00029F6259
NREHTSQCPLELLRFPQKIISAVSRDGFPPHPVYPHPGMHALPPPPPHHLHEDAWHHHPPQPHPGGRGGRFEVLTSLFSARVAV